MQLGSRASKKYSDPNAWHNHFYSLVTTKSDEEKYTTQMICILVAFVALLVYIMFAAHKKKSHE